MGVISQVKVTQEALFSERRYVREDAEDILNLGDDVLREFLKIDADGVWISHQYPVGLSWVPNMELDGPDSPNPRTHPALPFPFSPNQLAAFFLHGIGGVVRECIGEWAKGPNESVLLRLPDQSTKAVEALRLAYQAFRVVASEVGASDFASCEDASDIYARCGKQMVVSLLSATPRVNQLDHASKVLGGRQIVSEGLTTHKVGGRQTQLDAVISVAEKQAVDPDRWMSVWDSLVVLASSPRPPSPLIGYVPNDGVKYAVDHETASVQFLSRNAFRRRMERRNRKLKDR